MRRASAITIFSGFTTRRTLETVSSVRICFTAVEVAVQPLDRREHLVAGDRQRRHPRHDRADRLHDAPLHREDPLDVPVHDLGQRQQPQRLGGRRAVDHQHVVRADSHVRLDVDQAEDLVEAGDHGELLGLDRLGARPVHQLDEVVLDLAPVLLEPLLGVDLLRPQVLARSAVGSSRSPPRTSRRASAPGRCTSRACACRRARRGPPSRRPRWSCRRRPSR